MNRWILLVVLSSVSCLCVSQADDDPPSTRKRVEAQPVRLFDGFDNGRFNASVRLYLSAWKNPRPAERVTSIDFVSLNTRAAPFCVAMTLEQSDGR